MNKALHATLLGLFLPLYSGISFAQAPLVQPPAQVLTEAQLREVQKYRAEERAKQRKHIDHLAGQIAKLPESSDQAGKYTQSLDAAKTRLEKSEQQTDSHMWTELVFGKRKANYKWQEPSGAADGKADDGTWIPILTKAQREEVDRWVKKELAAIKEMTRMRAERIEAVQSGDTGKCRLIDDAYTRLKARVQIPLDGYADQRWEAIVKEQDRLGYEWVEPTSEKEKPPYRGSWQAKRAKAE